MFLRRFVFLLSVFVFLNLYAENQIDQNIDDDMITDSDIIQQEEHSSDTDNTVSSEPATDENENYSIKLRTLEEKINSLKDKVFRAKQRLAMLQETVLTGSIAGARAKVVHRNDIGSAFRLVSAIYYLDEAPVFKKVNNAGDLSGEKITVFDGSVVPGPHHVSVRLVYIGKGYGLFSYMKGYTFRIKAGYSFNVDEGTEVIISSTAEDHGSLYNLEERLYISFDKQEKAYEKPLDKE